MTLTHDVTPSFLITAMAVDGLSILMGILGLLQQSEWDSSIGESITLAKRNMGNEIYHRIVMPFIPRLLMWPRG